MKIAEECEEPFTASGMREMLIQKHGTRAPCTSSIGVFLKRTFYVVGKRSDVNLYKGKK